MAQKKKKKEQEQIILPHGIDVDLDEAWKKLIANQFPGSPGRGFGELIQNFLDSYPSSVPWMERRGEIEGSLKAITITDYGEGMNRNRLALLVTLGGTDKNNDSSKIGTFGVGFFSIFNPKLGTRQVRLITRCEGQSVEMVFRVTRSGCRPKISTRILDDEIPFSTRILVLFTNEKAVELCLQHAESCLKYYPCQVTINGRPHQSVWHKAEQEGARLFQKGNCHGFIQTGHSSYGNTTLLCKYEFLLKASLASLLMGGRNMHYDLRDYRHRSMPYLENMVATINCNDLNVTISRDSFTMDAAYEEMIHSFAKVLLRELSKQLAESFSSRLVIANQFTLVRYLDNYFHSPQWRKRADPDTMRVVEMLAQAKVYRINGRKESFSLEDIFEMKQKDLPLFYSPKQLNLHWLGGNFKHDFIVLPPQCSVGGGAPNLFDLIFDRIFKNIVDLDSIEKQPERIDELIHDGIVEREALHPNIQFAGERSLTEEEKQFLEELDAFFALPAIRDAITGNLFLRVKSIKTVFFDIHDQKAVIATGLFDDEGKVLAESTHCNLDVKADGVEKAEDNGEIVLGLHREHDMIRAMIANRDPHRLYFALPILAHELALCQKQLVPYSPGYHLVKERLAADMRNALMNHLLMKKAA